MTDPLLTAILGDGTRRMTLAFGPQNESMREQLLKTKHLPPAVQAGLWLYHDFFEESHAISQDLSTPEGSYWHAILHRREPDAFNAKYWFRSVGHHAIFEALAAQAHEVDSTFSKTTWDPLRFVDLCEEFRGSSRAMEAKLEQVQLIEWRLLFEYR
ncbi:hypothetical protein BH11PLA2_BH11PLA2_19430 [soil metagenome]